MGIAPGVLFSIAGACIAATGAALKFVVVTRAGFNQGFALVHTPVRGSGIAGPAVKARLVNALKLSSEGEFHEHAHGNQDIGNLHVRSRC